MMLTGSSYFATEGSNFRLEAARGRRAELIPIHGSGGCFLSFGIQRGTATR